MSLGSVESPLFLSHLSGEEDRVEHMCPIVGFLSHLSGEEDSSLLNVDNLKFLSHLSGEEAARLWRA